MKIAILGAPRSGTTALFYRQKAVLPATTRCLFEPAAYVSVPGDEDSGVLIKMLVGALPGETPADYTSLRDFDTLYGLVRDPRDRLVSFVLFAMQWASPQWPPLYRQPGWVSLLSLLHEKERHPGRIPFAQLFESVMQSRFGFDGTQARQWWQEQVLHGLQVYAILPITPRFFERLDDRPFLARPIPLAREHASILRRGSIGDWRHWFTRADEGYFAPFLRDYMHEYGYSTDWNLATPQRIDARTSSRYVLKWARARWLAARRAEHGAPLA